MAGWESLLPQANAIKPTTLSDYWQPNQGDMAVKAATVANMMDEQKTRQLQRRLGERALRLDEESDDLAKSMLSIVHSTPQPGDVMTSWGYANPQEVGTRFTQFPLAGSAERQKIQAAQAAQETKAATSMETFVNEMVKKYRMTPESAAQAHVALATGGFPGLMALPEWKGLLSNELSTNSLQQPAQGQNAPPSPAPTLQQFGINTPGVTRGISPEAGMSTNTLQNIAARVNSPAGMVPGNPMAGRTPTPQPPTVPPMRPGVMPPPQQAGMSSAPSFQRYIPEQHQDDYDMVAAKAAGERPDLTTGHMTDKYKKPGYITFSDESIYSKPGQEGGKWRYLDGKGKEVEEGARGGKWHFYPSPFNLSQHNVAQMKDYFQIYEPTSVLELPARTGQSGMPLAPPVMPKVGPNPPGPTPTIGQQPNAAPGPYAEGMGPSGQKYIIATKAAYDELKNNGMLPPNARVLQGQGPAVVAAPATAAAAGTSQAPASPFTNSAFDKAQQEIKAAKALPDPDARYDALERIVAPPGSENDLNLPSILLNAYRKASLKKAKNESALTMAQELNDPKTTPERRAQIQKTLKEDEQRQIRITGAKSGAVTQARQDAEMKGIDMKNIPEGVKRTAKMLTEYKIPLPSGFALRQPYWQQALAVAGEMDPDFDASQYNVRMKVKTAFTTGKEAQNIVGLNTAVGHLDAFRKASEALKNGNFTSANGAYNVLSRYFPVTPDLVKRQGLISGVRTKFNATKGEMASIFKANGATDPEIKSWESTIDDPAAATPQMWKAFTDGALELMGSRMEARRGQYEVGMGKPKDFHFLNEKSRGILKELGVNVDEWDPVAKKGDNKSGAAKDPSKMSNDELLNALRQ